MHGQVLAQLASHACTARHRVRSLTSQCDAIRLLRIRQEVRLAGWTRGHDALPFSHCTPASSIRHAGRGSLHGHRKVKRIREPPPRTFVGPPEVGCREDRASSRGRRKRRRLTVTLTMRVTSTASRSATSQTRFRYSTSRWRAVCAGIRRCFTEPSLIATEDTSTGIRSNC